MEFDISLPSVGAAYANKLLAQPGVFDDLAHDRRIIQGIAATKKMKMYGAPFDPGGARCDLPIPLLFTHDWKFPCGRVTAIKTTLAGLWFEARIIDAGLEWAERCWGHLKAGRLPDVSIQSWPMPPHDWSLWSLFEISICQDGACPDALIHVVKSVLNPRIVYLDGRPRETIYRDIRPSSKGVPTATQSARASA